MGNFFFPTIIDSFLDPITLDEIKELQLDETYFQDLSNSELFQKVEHLLRPKIKRQYIQGFVDVGLKGIIRDLPDIQVASISSYHPEYLTFITEFTFQLGYFLGCQVTDKEYQQDEKYKELGSIIERLSRGMTRKAEIDEKMLEYVTQSSTKTHFHTKLEGDLNVISETLNNICVALKLPKVTHRSAVSDIKEKETKNPTVLNVEDGQTGSSNNDSGSDTSSIRSLKSTSKFKLDVKDKKKKKVVEEKSITSSEDSDSSSSITTVHKKKKEAKYQKGLRRVNTNMKVLE